MEKKGGRLIGQLRLTRPDPRVVGVTVVRPDGQATCVVGGRTLVGDGTGTALPALDALQPQRLRHAPSLYHRRAAMAGTGMESIGREVTQVRRLMRLTLERAQQRVAQAHGYGSWDELTQAVKP